MELIDPTSRPLGDAGPLIHLDEVGCLDLLSDFPAILIPDSVWNEVDRHRPSALQYPRITLTKVRPAGPIAPQLLSLAQVLNLHLGEKDAIHVCMERENALLLTDDTAARLAAASLQIKAHGTLGILIRAIRRNQRSKDHVLAILKMIPTESSLHIKRTLLESIIAEVKQNA